MNLNSRTFFLKYDNNDNNDYAYQYVIFILFCRTGGKENFFHCKTCGE